MSAGVPGLLQPIEYRALDPHGITQTIAGLLDYGIDTLKAKTGHLTKAVWAFPYQAHAVGSKKLVDLHGRIGRDFERRQDRQKLPHGLAFRIAGLDLLQPFLCNAADLQELFRRLFQHLQRVNSKVSDNGLSRSRTNAPEQSR